VAAFETWSHEVLVRFARDAQAKLNHLEAEVQELLQDRKDLITEVRRLITEGAKNGNERLAQDPHTHR
jgi:hypothetical protein